MANVFVSYASEDRAQAGRIAQALENCGWSVWWDRKITAGHHFDQVIERELDSADAVVVLWSARSIHSEWVKNEAAAAADRGVLVPACIEACRPPLEFRRRQAADLSTWNGDPTEPGFQALADGVAHLCSRPTVAAAGGTPKSAAPAAAGKHPWILGSVAAVVIGLGGYAGLLLLVTDRIDVPSPPSPTTTTVPIPKADASTVEDKKIQPEVEIAGKAGVLEMSWPGGDCWAVYRGDKQAMYSCGGGKHALQTGTYVVKPLHSVVFAPQSIEVKSGSVTRPDLRAGWFDFQWPGGDCWEVYRGETKAKNSCGGGKHALQAGTYLVKPAHSAVFEPFKVEIVAGATAVAP